MMDLKGDERGKKRKILPNDNKKKTNKQKKPHNLFNMHITRSDFMTEILQSGVFRTSGGFLRDTWPASSLFVATPVLLLELLNEAAE